MVDFHQLIHDLAVTRELFHSESDFQHALAWHMHKLLPEAAIRLERPVRTQNEVFHVDLWLQYRDQTTAIELKYRTAILDTVRRGERYALKNQGAQDLGRYDFIKDIRRIERIVDTSPNTAGAAILLTNDKSYWTEPKSRHTIDKDFRLHNGKLLKDSMRWAGRAAKGTTKNRESPIQLRGTYRVEWQEFSLGPASNNSGFRFLVVEVPAVEAK